jgi:hypothetical protein
MSSYGNLVRIIRNGKLLQHQSLEQRTNLLDLMGIQGILKRKLKLDQRTQVRYMDEYLLIEQFQIAFQYSLCSNFVPVDLNCCCVILNISNAVPFSSKFKSVPSYESSHNVRVHPEYVQRFQVRFEINSPSAFEPSINWMKVQQRTKNIQQRTKNQGNFVFEGRNIVWLRIGKVIITNPKSSLPWFFVRCWIFFVRCWTFIQLILGSKADGLFISKRTWKRWTYSGWTRTLWLDSYDGTDLNFDENGTAFEMFRITQQQLRSTGTKLLQRNYWNEIWNLPRKTNSKYQKYTNLIITNDSTSKTHL